MSRDQQNQTFKQAQANSQQDQGNAQTAFGGARGALGDFSGRLASYYSSDPFQTGGEFQRDQTTINAGRATANANALSNELNLTAKRSGENTASFAPTLAAAQRQGVMDTADAQAKSDAARLENETRYQQYGLDASKFPVQANDQLYSTSLGGSNSALGAQESAAKSPGLWDTLFTDAVQGAKTGGEIAAA